MARETKAMSALGQKQTFALRNAMSALPPKADMCAAKSDVRFVPIADIGPVLACPLWRKAAPEVELIPVRPCVALLEISPFE